MNPLIESHPGVMMGKPVIRGTRIAVEHILEKLASGETIEQVLQAHPRPTRQAVLAAIEFGAQALRADVGGMLTSLVAQRLQAE
jgi:uncharacterized protein (DUF433 family)